MPSRSHLSAQLYPNPQAATSSAAGSNNNNHNCCKMTPGLSQRGGGGGLRRGDGWSVVESRYQIAEGKNRNEKKGEWWELEKALDKGQRAPKEWWRGSGDLPARRKALNLFICSAVLSSHLQLSPLCGVILYRPPLFFFSQPQPVPLGLGIRFFFLFVKTRHNMRQTVTVSRRIDVTKW